jgi:hypothetical protein
MRKLVLNDDEIEQCDEQTSRRRDAGGDELDALGRQLKAARPLLVSRVTPGELTPEGGQLMQVVPGILDHPLEWDELDCEGYDPIGRTGLGPVYYRVIRIGDKWFYLSTAQVPRAAVLMGWGKAGVAQWKKDGKIFQIMTLLPPPCREMLR